MKRLYGIVLSFLVGMLVAGAVIMLMRALWGDPPNNVSRAGYCSQAQIQRWMDVKHLNKYGDPQDKMYTGGDPLFNEATGEFTDYCAYMIKKFPYKPWETY